MRQSSPATARNKEPIREVLARVLPASGGVLEIASGAGEHAVHMAGAFPHLVWQPTDPDDVALASIAAWQASAGLPNLRAPVKLDVRDPAWPAANAIVCINMIHISPWEATLGLFAGAARTLAAGELLFTYGPYRQGGVTAPSNEAFDASLRSRDVRWGIRDVGELRSAAVGLELVEIVAMPANNHSLVFRRC
jgi:Protein of unknown function (DUF938)